MSNQITQNNISPFDTPESEDILIEKRQTEYEEFLDFLHNYKILIDEETNFYIIEREKENEGMYELFGTTKEEINKTLRINKFWEIKDREIKKKKEEQKKTFENRFKIPNLKTKKEYTEYYKKITEIIRMLDDEWKKDNTNESLEEEINNYVETRRKLKAVMSGPKNDNFGADVAKAKAFPIESIIDFNRAGVACCISHQEKTPSMKWYKKQNKAFCFGCQKSFDSIDAYIIINNCSFEVAIKNLK